MALRCPARAFTAAKLLIRCRTPLSSLAHGSRLPVVVVDAGCNRQIPLRQHACRSACSTRCPPAMHRRHCSGLAAASSLHIRQHVATAPRSPASAAAAVSGCSTSVQRHQRRHAATAAAVAYAASALAAPGSTTVTAEELVAAHLAAIDSNRSKALFVWCLCCLQVRLWPS